MRRLPLLLALALPACADETISGYADPSAIYRLTELYGQSVTAHATITFPDQGQARGVAPCNSWSASQTAPYPWFRLGPIAATRRACADLVNEQRFFDALSGMTLAEVQGPVLILSNDDGREMVFRSDVAEN